MRLFGSYEAIRGENKRVGKLQSCLCALKRRKRSSQKAQRVTSEPDKVSIIFPISTYLFFVHLKKKISKLRTFKKNLLHVLKLTMCFFLLVYVFVSFDSRKNSIVLRTQLSVRVHGIMGNEKN